MALWKISVKNEVNKVGLRLEKGMFVEMATTSPSNPLTTNFSKNAPVINNLFQNKYGIELGHYVNTAYLKAEEI